MTCNNQVFSESDFCPHFIIAGAQKSGTTWLYNALKACPEVYMPEHRKEVNYFNHYYDKGAAWYQNFFREGILQAKVCGEASPEYIVSDDALARIVKDCPSTKLILVLRNPVKRTLSHFAHLIRTKNISTDFDAAIKEYGDIVDWSHYQKQLKKVEHLHDSGMLKILIFEEMIRQPEKKLREVSMFIGIKNANSLHPINDSEYSFYEPQHKRLYVVARRISDCLRHFGFDKLVNIYKKKFIKLFGSRTSVRPDLSLAQQSRLMESFEEDVRYIEQLLGRKLMDWR